VLGQDPGSHILPRSRPNTLWAGGVFYTIPKVSHIPTDGKKQEALLRAAVIIVFFC